MTTNTAPYIKVKNISTYIAANRERDNHYAIYYPSGYFVYIHNGIAVDGIEFEANHPPPVLQENKLDKGFRLDSRSNWFD